MIWVWISLSVIGVVFLLVLVVFVSLAGSGLRGGEYEPPGGSHGTDHRI